MQRLVLILSVMLAGVLLTLGAGRSDTTMVGKKLPALRLDYVGARPDLKGKPAIIEFWATWCPPCRESIPHLNDIHREFKDAGLVVIGITDEDNQTIRRFTKEVPMNYFVATDPSGKLSEAFGVDGIPHAVLVDKSGKIVWEGHPMGLTQTVIRSVLK